MNRYYSQAQFNQMSVMDSCAVLRSFVPDSAFICYSCGSVDYFMFKTKMPYRLTSRKGMVLSEPTGEYVRLIKPGTKLTYNQLIDIGWDYNNAIAAICYRCQGPVVIYRQVTEHCEKTDCPGCMLCGKVIPVVEIEDRILNCAVCWGGEKECIDKCKNEYMREYHEIGIISSADSNNKGF